MSEGQPSKINLSVNLPEEVDIFSIYKEKTVVPESGEEGQLCVDVAETEVELIIVCPMAGTPPKSLELHLHNDLLTVKGERHSVIPKSAYYHNKECYFGRFSRSVVMPTDVKVENSSAEYKNGLLTIRIPKAKSDLNIPVYIVEE